MALRQLKLENFRGKNQSYELYEQSRIKGKNGVGKSTIKEAICFLFTGTDSVGNRNPQHLISMGTESCKVEAITDKATLSRTLTKKGNGTIRMTREGITSTLAQEQLSKMVGSQDLFLSIFCPGYFFSLSSDKKHKVFSEVLPKIDRDALFFELAGYKCLFDLSPRADLVVSKISTERRALERTCDRLAGELNALNQVQEVPLPVQPPEAASFEYLKNLSQEWERYRREKFFFDENQKQLSFYQKKKQDHEKRLEDIRKTLESLKTVPEPDFQEIEQARQQIDQCKKLIQNLPQRPAYQATVDSERCNSCGQIVSSKHRESIRAYNLKLDQEFEQRCQEVKNENVKVQTEINRLSEWLNKIYPEWTKARKYNEDVAAKRRELQFELSASAKHTPMAPETVSEPIPPREVLNPEELLKATQAHEEYKSKRYLYDEAQKQLQSLEAKKEGIRSQIETLKKNIETLQHTTSIVEQLPGEEARRQQKLLQMETLEMDEFYNIRQNNVPYEILSTGQQMKAQIEVSLKLNSMRSVGMIFVDNADLIDQVTVGEVQLFVAEVDSQLETVHIEQL